MCFARDSIVKEIKSLTRCLKGIGKKDVHLLTILEFITCLLEIKREIEMANDIRSHHDLKAKQTIKQMVLNIVIPVIG